MGDAHDLSKKGDSSNITSLSLLSAALRLALLALQSSRCAVLFEITSVCIEDNFMQQSSNLSCIMIFEFVVAISSFLC
jgi:hypothetical protein